MPLPLALFALLSTHLPAARRTSEPVVFVPYEQAYPAGFKDMQRHIPELTRIRQTVGWQPCLLLDRILCDVLESSAHLRRCYEGQRYAILAYDGCSLLPYAACSQARM